MKYFYVNTNKQKSTYRLCICNFCTHLPLCQSRPFHFKEEKVLTAVWNDVISKSIFVWKSFLIGKWYCFLLQVVNFNRIKARLISVVWFGYRNKTSLCMYTYMFVSAVVKTGSSISLVIVVLLVDEHKGIAMKYHSPESNLFSLLSAFSFVFSYGLWCTFFIEISYLL